MPKREGEPEPENNTPGEEAELRQRDVELVAQYNGEELEMHLDSVTESIERDKNHVEFLKNSIAQNLEFKKALEAEKKRRQEKAE
jgi:hypothetical protein